MHAIFESVVGHTFRMGELTACTVFSTVWLTRFRFRESHSSIEAKTFSCLSDLFSTITTYLILTAETTCFTFKTYPEDIRTCVLLQENKTESSK